MDIPEYYEERLQVISTPLIFCDTAGPCIVDWIALGTDGDFYVAPDVPGGWLQRTRYTGPMGRLSPVDAVKARTIAWFLYGDDGLDEVEIAQSSSPDTQLNSISAESFVAGWLGLEP